MSTIPNNKTEALEALAALDAARWGESEREPSRKLNSSKSYGLLLNSIVHHHLHDYGDAAPAELRAAAKAALTSDDRDELRKGG